MSQLKKITTFIIAALTVLTFSLNANAQTVPSVTTGEVVFRSANSVYLTATVNPQGSFTQVRFQVDPTSPPVTMRGSLITTGTQTSPVYIRAIMEDFELKPDTTYYYRPVAQNSSGFAYGEIRSFKTPSAGDSTSSGNSGSSNNTSNSNNASNNNVTGSVNNNSGTQSAPRALTNGPASVSVNSAVINGSVNPNGASTNFWFEFGVTQSLDQITTSQLAGNSNSWLLVTGNLSGLESGKTYYYRVVAQNNYGTSRGDIVSFTAGANQTSEANQTGQVSGAVSGNANSPSPTRGSARPKSIVSNTARSQRPSFISLEYSLNDSGALVLIADEVKPKPGDDFSYTVVYKNDTSYSFNEAKLKVIVPSEAYYVSSNLEPVKTSGNIIEFNLGAVGSNDRGEVAVVVRIREDVISGTNMIFTSVLGYKNRFGTQLATTSYLIARAGGTDTSLSASLLGSFFGGSGMLWLVALGLVVLMGVLTYGLVKIKRRNGVSGKEDNFGLGSIPATFEPIVSPLGRPDIFQSVKK